MFDVALLILWWLEELKRKTEDGRRSGEGDTVVWGT